MSYVTVYVYRSLWMSMHAIDAVVTVGWIAFWLFWLVAATQAKSGRSGFRRYAVARLLVAALVIGLVHIPALRGPATHSLWLAGIGVAVFLSGLVLAVWARFHLGRNWGSPMSEKRDPELVTSGPYRWIRNPIYSGLILALVGTAIAVDVGWFVVVVPVSGYFVFSAFMEQRFLAAQFPDTYPGYRRSTKMLVPFVF